PLLVLHCGTAPPSFVLFSCPRSASHRYPHSFPTRRSSDLPPPEPRYRPCSAARAIAAVLCAPAVEAGSGFHEHTRQRPAPAPRTDRKSTRLNSSHQIISYAVFCLKKKREFRALANHLTEQA